MKICLISKYPPIEGGVCSKNYWLAKELGKRGHKVFVVTNSWEVEDEYREVFNSSDLDKYQPKNVTLFNTDSPSNLRHIPHSKIFVEKISSLAIETIEKYNVEVIDSKYMIPYVVAGYIASNLTDKPQILRHAGSDMSRLLYSPYLKPLFIKIFRNVDKIVTRSSMVWEFKNFGVPEENIILGEYYSIDTEEFNPKKAGSLKEYGVDGDLPIITFIGKPSRQRGILSLLDACKKIPHKFTILLVIGKHGRQSEIITQEIKKLNLEDKARIIDFLPPWRIPKILASSTAVVCPEYNFPVAGHSSIIPREAMACGTCPIISKELEEKNSWMRIEDGRDVVVVDPTNTKNFSKRLEEIINNSKMAERIGKSARKKSEEIENFENHVSEMSEIYESVIRK